MRKSFADLVHEASSTTGTGPLALTPVAGFPRFSDRFTDGEQTYYSIRNGLNWEVGHGHYLAPNQLARSRVTGTYASGVWSNADLPLTLVGQSVVRAVSPTEYLAALWKVEYVDTIVNTNLEQGKSYGVRALNLQLLLPPLAEQGDRIEIFEAVPNITGTVLLANGHKINGVIGNMDIDLPQFCFVLVYVDATTGWRVR